jgi:diguanylate cyclase
MSENTSLPANQLAKGALRRLALDKLEPTPENYERAYRLESGQLPGTTTLPERAQRLIERLAQRAFEGDTAATTGGAPNEFTQALASGRWELAERVLLSAGTTDASGLCSLIERLARGLERGGRNWTLARKKEGLQRVLHGSRSDARRLQQRLSQLVLSWDTDVVDSVLETPAAAQAMPADPPPTAPQALCTIPGESESLLSPQPPHSLEQSAAVHSAGSTVLWAPVINAMALALEQALPLDRTCAPHELATELAQLRERLSRDPDLGEQAQQLTQLCIRMGPVLQHRHHLLEQLTHLCQELTESITDLAEDDSWAQGQCELMRAKIEEGLSARGIRAVSELLHDTRARQGRLRAERAQARDSLKGLINRMLNELGELGSQTGVFHENVGRYADVIEKADSLEGLAGVVREMVEQSRTVQAVVQQTQVRLQEEHSNARRLTQRVVELEEEMQRLSDEVCTDQLTQVANRRGLMQAFEAERGRHERTGKPLSIGLLDIDNFKRLNDELGHGAGDEALKALAALVSTTLRPTDVVARYGGEEFVVLLPETSPEEAQPILTRLQRTLTGGLFMHEQKQVFVTFSAGVTLYRLNERIEDSLERADQSLYVAKRSGKNRTCLA